MSSNTFRVDQAILTGMSPVLLITFYLRSHKNYLCQLVLSTTSCQLFSPPINLWNEYAFSYCIIASTTIVDLFHVIIFKLTIYSTLYSYSQYQLFPPEIAGESCSVEKDVDCTLTTNAVYQDKKNILFSVGVITRSCIS